MHTIRFDTRQKKPKLYHLLGLAFLAAVIVAVLALTGAQRHAIAICAVMLALCVLTIVCLLLAFRGQLQYNPYSYNTIYYAGFALFMVSVLATHVMLLHNLIRYPELYNAHEIMHLLLGSAKIYMLLSFPFLLIFSIALCVSNISLILHEGRRLVNVLGIILSFLLVAGALFIYRLDFYTSGSQMQVMLHDLGVNFLSAVYLYFECMLIGTIIANAIVVRYEPDPDKDFLIVLGCGLRADGTPTPLLRGRLDRALAFYEKQKARTGRELTLIASGGRGAVEVVSESAAMKQYLMERGVPETQIVEEDRSTDTFENMRFSRDIILALDPGGKIAFSTTNYHVFRSGLYARRVKMRAVGMGAKTKWYFWPNAAVREFVGLLTEHRGKQALIFGSLVVFYTVLTLLVYL